MSRNVPLRAAPFRVDVTPPTGHPIAYGVNRKVDSPLYVRGIVLDDGRTRAVMAVADFIGIAGRARQAWRNLIARSAGAPANQVFLHTVHQHDSVQVCFEADEIIKRLGFEPKVNPAYWRKISAKLEQAIRQAVLPGKRGNWRKVAQLAVAERRVSRLGANRRILGKDGKVRAMRWSMCSNPALQREPVGLIDPILRSVGFIDPAGRIIAAMHFYATHPQVAYNRNMAGSDVPGVALRRLEKSVDGTHLYFTGCGANVTFGKYTFASREKSLRVIGDRLGLALIANARSLQRRPVGRLAFARARFELPLNKRFTKKLLLGGLRKITDPAHAQYQACKLVLLRNWKAWHRPVVSRMSIGPEVHVLSLPSEVVVEYQLYAQGLVPENFLACAAYGNYSYFYLPTAAMYAEGGYEPSTGIYTPAIEPALKSAISKALAGVNE